MADKKLIPVLYISYDGMTDPLGQSQVIPYLQGLSKLGYQFTLLSFEKQENYRKSASAIREILKASNIEWVPLSYTKKPPILSTLWDIWKMKRKAFVLQKQKCFNIVHCRSYISSFVGRSLKKNFGTRFIFDMRGFYADERVDGNIWRLKNPIYRAVYHYFKRKEREFLSAADYVITLTQKAKTIIQSWKEVEGQSLSIQVIPCCADLEHFSPASVDEELKWQLKQKLKLNDNAFVLVYLGSIGTWYMLPEMMNFFVALLKQKPEAKFLFVTADPPEEIHRVAEAKGIAKSSLAICRAARKEVPTYLSLADWSIFFIKPVFSKQASSPTKHGELMGMGIPVVCNTSVGDVDWIMQQAPQSGILVDAGQKDFEKDIERMLSFPINHESIRHSALSIYSLTEGISHYTEVYRTVLK